MLRPAALLVLVTLCAPAFADNTPTLGGGPGMDLSCEAMPGEAPGHFVCEDPDSYARCKALVGKAMVRVDGGDEKTPVVACQQGG